MPSWVTSLVVAARRCPRLGKTRSPKRSRGPGKGRGWLVAAESARPGALDRLVGDHLVPFLIDRLGESHPTVTSLSAFGFGLGRQPGGTPDGLEARPGIRSLLRQLTDSLDETDVGVLITLDEIQGADIDELRAISDVIQHSFREERPVAFVAAGLPHGVDSLLNDDVSTFIRRAQRYELGPVDDADVRRALQVPIEAAGRDITAAALDQAVEATGGYPFMIQLTGYHLYRQSDDQMIDRAAAEAAIPAAQRRLGQLVYEPVLADLSPVDRSFLMAMAHSEGPAAISDIADRLGADANYTSQYRLRLIRHDIIQPAGRGMVEFVLPHLREYLQAHAAMLAPTNTVTDASKPSTRPSPPG